MKKSLRYFYFFAAFLFSLPIYSESVWDGTASVWTAGSGTNSDPYQIQTAQNLAYLAQTVNADNSYAGNYFIQTDDIDLNDIEWIPIGSDTYKFKGVFDGAGHVIKKIKITKSRELNGLFGYTTNTIKNLSVSGLVRGGNCLGGITGQNSGRIENCKNDCNVSSTVIGARVYAGGISGYGGGSFTNCSNTGSVTASSNQTSYAGGISGYLGSFTNCSNTGLVSSYSAKSLYTDAYAGGISGYTGGSFTNCSNIGSVSASSSTTSSYTSSSSHAGGISSCIGRTFTNCSNTGSISASSSGSGICEAGGILCGGDEGFTTITSCYNRGEINSEGASYGIAEKATIVNSYNVGTLSTGSYKYGIGNGTVTNSYYLNSCGGSGNGIVKTEQEMRSESFPDMLNGESEAVFVQDINNVNDGFPIFNFVVRFLNYDGTILQSETLAYGETPCYKGVEPQRPSSKKYSYRFKGWNNTITSVDKNIDYKATYTYTINKYLITFENYNGDVLQSGEVEYGQMPSYLGATPEKPADAEFTYTFSGWSPEVVAVVDAQTYTAQFSSTVNKYLIRFLNEDGSVLQTEELDYGTDPVYKGETPTKQPTAQYTYTFNAWDSEIGKVTGAKDYTATYSSIVNKYLITFENYNGDELQSSEVEYGQIPLYTGNTPEKPADAEFTYTFSGWSPEVVSVVGAQTYAAQYSSTVNKYIIRFLNEDGTELQSEELDYGIVPVYSGETPTKQPTAQYTYTFKGWDSDIVSVTRAKDYTATYTSTVNKYLITFENYDGTELQRKEVSYGDTPVYTGAPPVKPSTEQYSYSFNGWDSEIVAVDESKTYTAQFSSTTNKYLVRFLNEDGTELQNEEIEYGAIPVYTGETPTKQSTAQYTYTFNGWNSEIEKVTGSKDYTAIYTSTVNKYLITFENYNGDELQSSEVEYGQISSYTGATPIKPADAEFTYTFSGWSPEVVSVVGAQTYTAQFSSTVNKYVIRFLNEDGTELQSEELEYGSVPVYKGEVPTKQPTAQYTYTFNGWDSEIGEVTGSKDYTATYTSTVNKYLITFENYNGEELQSSEVEYGQTPSYTGATPEKPADAEFTYTFSDWSPEVVSVVGAQTYTAQFSSTVNKYVVRFLNEDGTELQSEELAYGATPAYTGETPTKDATAQYTYTFNGWDSEIAEVTGAKDYTATYTPTTNKYTVRFLNDDGTELQSEKLAYGATPAYTGETPTKEATAQYTYTFAGWDSEITEVTGAKDYTATYSPTTNKYVVRFLNEDGTELQSEELAYGATPAYTGETPTKEATAQYTYTFAGWDSEIAEVTGAKDYTATYTPTTNKYLVRFLNYDGTELQKENLDYGVTPSYKGGTPTKPSTAQYTYTFNGWEPAITSVTGAKDYTATYTSSVNKYEIKFVNYDGSELQSGEVEYGKTPAYTGVTPTKPGTAQYTFTFSGWSPAIEAVTGAQTYTAQFSSTTNKYQIRFLNYDGTELQKENLDYGVTPSYKGGTPTKPSTAQYSYTFKGWEPAITSVTGAKDYTATYSSTVNKYEIKFVNYDGSELQSGEVEYGKTPAYTGVTPTKPGTAQYTFTFSGWSPAIEAVTGAQTYTAQFSSTTNKYKVTTKAETEGVTTGDGIYEYGTEVTLTATPNDKYEFVRWSNGSTSAEINITVTEDVEFIAYFQFKPCTVEKNIEVSVPEGGTLTLKSGKVITVTKSQKLDDLKITPLECDSLFHYDITMIRQNADNTPECDGAPSVAKFDWLLMLNVKSLNSLGYKFSESSVSWYRVVGDIDNLDDPESKRNDIIVGTGYGYTIDKSLAGTGDYYALIDLPVQTADVGCKGIMRTSVHHYSKSVTVKPYVVPTITAPNQRMQVLDLPLGENVEILVYDYVGRLCQTFTSQGDATAWFDAEKAAGNYMVVIKTAEGVETVKYIVKGK